MVKAVRALTSVRRGSQNYRLRYFEVQMPYYEFLVRATVMLMVFALVAGAGYGLHLIHEK
jgi:hypothetical protein